MSGNSTERFLRALYENAGGGALSVSYLGENDLPITRWFTKDQLGEMAAYAVECGRMHNTCLNINPRVEALDTYHRGMSDKVLEVVAVYQDFDIKGPAHAQKCLPESEKDALDYLAELPHPPSFIIRSGNGVHAYWIFRQPYRIRDGTDRAYIEGILDGFESYAIKLAYECALVLRDRKDNPVIVFRSKDPDFPVWKVECGYSCCVFLTRAEAMAFCEKRYKRVKGGSA